MREARRRTPEARYEGRESIALAFIAGLQRLPPRQRAVLLLRDVAGFSAAEVAEMLKTTTGSVAGMLGHARATLNRYVPANRELPPLRGSERERELLRRFEHALLARQGDRRARVVWTRANGQPACGLYLEDGDAAVLRCASVIVLTLERDRIARLSRFADPAISARLGLPPTL
jgi:hypothetical protein